MKDRITTYQLFCGSLIPVWMILGVGLTGLFYPGYSHLNQALSELGAVGAPTFTFSPFVNNFPLCLLFVLFGLGIRQQTSHWSAYLIILHGVGHFFTGAFPCDEGCLPVVLSVSQIIHNIAGLILFLSLLAFCIVWTFILIKRYKAHSIATFAAFSALISVVSLPMMLSAIESGGFGLYQRINLGFPLTFVGALSIFLLSQFRTKEL